jgi:hypothetical protein
MVIEIDEIDVTGLQAEIHFRSLNFYAALLAYGGFIISSRNDSQDQAQAIVITIIIALMIIDAIRLSWFCIKSVKKADAFFQLGDDGGPSSRRGNKYA